MLRECLKVGYCKDQWNSSRRSLVISLSLGPLPLLVFVIIGRCCEESACLYFFPSESCFVFSVLDKSLEGSEETVGLIQLTFIEGLAERDLVGSAPNCRWVGVSRCKWARGFVRRSRVALLPTLLRGPSLRAVSYSAQFQGDFSWYGWIFPPIWMVWKTLANDLKESFFYRVLPNTYVDVTGIRHPATNRTGQRSLLLTFSRFLPYFVTLSAPPPLKLMWLSLESLHWCPGVKGEKDNSSVWVLYFT